MSFISKVNILRRSLMRSMTKDIGKSDATQEYVFFDKKDIKKILICRPNARLGNLLLITPLVQEVEETFPNCKVDLFVKGTLAPIIFENYNCVSKIIALPKKPFHNLWRYLNVWISIKKEKYDLVINLDQGSSSGRLATKYSNSKYKFFGDLPVQTVLDNECSNHIAKYPIYNFRNYLSKFGIEKGNEKIPTLDIKLSSYEIAQGKVDLDNLVDDSKKTICLFTYATGSKCLSKSWWRDFYTNLKSEYKNYNIIEILPIENVSQIDFKAPVFYSNDIRKIAALMANTDLFIGADSGIMHLASAVKIPTLGLFSVSSQKKYEPYNKGSLGIDVNSYSLADYLNTLRRILIVN